MLANLDFALIIVVLTALAGVIWLFDSLFLRSGRVAKAARGEPVKEPVVVEYARSFFPILLIVLVIRSFLFEPFRIPSASMTPTLVTGDFIFVNKFAYGLRLPVINTKIVELGEPQRGDVVVFRLPSDPRVNYVKRVVGLPGDVVEYHTANKRITINGEPIPMANPQLILTNRLRLQGFIVTEHLEVWPRALEELGAMVATGALKYRETIAEGLESAPQAFLGLLKGKNFGKQLVKLA